MKRARFRNYIWAGVSIVVALLSGNAAAAQSTRPIDASKARIIEYWTPERRANAIPRDLVIDPRGLGYLRRPDGTLVPYGHNIAAQLPSTNQSVSPFAKPSGGAGSGSSDTTPPQISNMDPDGITIGASYTFKATVIDDSGVVKSVTFNIQKSGSTFVNSFSASNSGSNIWSLNVSGFTDGTWNWWVVAKDGAKRGGNTGTSKTVTFGVSTGSTGGGSGGTGSGDVVTSAEWTGGTVQTAAGRLYFEMPSSTKWQGPWTGYVCSGTVATDDTGGRSIIMTASHCVYDDVNKAFARNVMFIPNQAATTGSGTDLNCSNDPLGCWVPSFGVVDVNWTTRKFPDNIAWDYAYYVVKDSGAHSAGYTTASDVLDTAAGSLTVNFGKVAHDDSTTGKDSADYTYALGYSYNQDPKFMYCAQDMATEPTSGVDWWLGSCGLTGGSSGGPWMQPITGGNGPIISVNSWGYTNSPGMAGPMLVGTSAQCIFNSAIAEPFPSAPPPDGKAGTAVTTCGP